MPIIVVIESLFASRNELNSVMNVEAADKLDTSEAHNPKSIKLSMQPQL